MNLCFASLAKIRNIFFLFLLLLSKFVYYNILIHMALSRLIDGQTIKIDNHNTGTLYQWDEAIHLHKRMNSKQYRGIEVLIPLAPKGRLDFRGANEKKEIELKNEIRKAFSNHTIRTRFVNTLINSLSDLYNSSKISKDEWYELFVIVASRIAAYFDLKPKVKERIDNDIIRFSREKGLDIFIKADRDKESIIIGDDLNFINKI